MVCKILTRALIAGAVVHRITIGKVAYLVHFVKRQNGKSSDMPILLISVIIKLLRIMSIISFKTYLQKCVI